METIIARELKCLENQNKQVGRYRHFNKGLEIETQSVSSSLQFVFIFYSFLSFFFNKIKLAVDHS